MAGGSGSLLEVPLADYEESLDRAVFLATIASALFVSVLFESLVIAVAAPAGGGTAVAIGCAVAALFALWPLSMARMWRVGIGFYAVIVGLFIGLVLPLVSLLIVTDNAVRLARLARDFDASIGTGAVAAPLILTWAASLIVPCGLALRIASDGIRLARTPVEKIHLLLPAETGSPGLLQVISPLLGIHPVCRWIPEAGRRIAACALFVAAAAIRGFTITVIVFLYALQPIVSQNYAPVEFYNGTIYPHILLNTVLGFFLPLAVLVAGMALAGLPRRFARRLARVSVENLLAADRRTPILFLRSFRDDQVQLTWRRRSRIRKLFAFGEPSPTVDNVLLDEATPWGPVEAIGVPGKPPPFGAARTFVSDDEWQPTVQRLASAADAIAIVLDETEGVRWEMAHIKQSEYQRKTVFLLPPNLARPETAAQFFHHEPHGDGAIGGSAPAGWLPDHCIGWYHPKDGRTVILTSKTASAPSYIIALRLFRASEIHGYVPSGRAPTFTAQLPG